VSPRPQRRGRAALGAIGLGVLACAACCAGPLIAVVGSVGAASLLGAYWVPGLLVVVAAAAAVLAVLLVRRRRANACTVPAGPTTIELQTTRPDAVRVVSGPGPSRP
jgi:hypothetical protein